MYQLSAADIKSFRSQLSLKQEEFASLTGISRASISNYESGKGIPTKKACEKMIAVARENNYKFNIENDGIDYKKSMMDVLKNLNDSKMALAKAENQIFNITSGQQ